jgi:hypothetical protein
MEKLAHGAAAAVMVVVAQACGISLSVQFRMKSLERTTSGEKDRDRWRKGVIAFNGWEVRYCVLTPCATTSRCPGPRK